MSTEPWGRVAIAGGTDWPNVGRPNRTLHDERQNLLGPALIRSCLTHKFKRVFSSSCSVHAVLLDVDNKPWLVGRNEYHACGSAKDVVWDPTPLTDAATFPNTPQELLDDTIVHAATGRHHTVLVTASGAAYVAGQNSLGQAGQDTATYKEVKHFTKVDVNGDKVIMASAGISFTLFLTSKGQVWAVGGAEKGQLGHGKTGETIANSRVIIQDEYEPLRVQGLEDKHIIQIASGHQHSICMDADGYVWTWGHGGLGRLGHGQQKDCLSAALVERFASVTVQQRAAQVSCGATCSFVIDRDGVMWVFGKFKVTGDGSAGSPWMTPKYWQELMSYKFKLATGGSTTVFAVTQDWEEENVLGLGQGTNHGELALGADAKSKSASKMSRIETLKDVEVLDLSGGQNTTWFIVRPPATSDEKAAAQSQPAKPKRLEFNNVWDSGWNVKSSPPAPSESKETEQATTAAHDQGNLTTSSTTGDAWDSLLRFPEELKDPPSDACCICGALDEEPNEPPSVVCDRCERSMHLKCLNPPATEPPEGEMFCKFCLEEELVSDDKKKRKLSLDDSQANTKKSRT